LYIKLKKALEKKTNVKENKNIAISKKNKNKVFLLINLSDL